MEKFNKNKIFLKIFVNLILLKLKFFIIFKPNFFVVFLYLMFSLVFLDLNLIYFVPYFAESITAPLNSNIISEKEDLWYYPFSPKNYPWDYKKLEVADDIWRCCKQLAVFLWNVGGAMVVLGVGIWWGAAIADEIYISWYTFNQSYYWIWEKYNEIWIPYPQRLWWWPVCLDKWTPKVEAEVKVPTIPPYPPEWMPDYTVQILRQIVPWENIGEYGPLQKNSEPPMYFPNVGLLWSTGDYITPKCLKVMINEYMDLYPKKYQDRYWAFYSIRYDLDKIEEAKIWSLTWKEKVTNYTELIRVEPYIHE